MHATFDQYTHIVCVPKKSVVGTEMGRILYCVVCKIDLQKKAISPQIESLMCMSEVMPPRTLLGHVYAVSVSALC